MKIAVNGCCHGELNTIYASVPFDTDLLLICGDFQAFRNPADMEAASIPQKYRQMGDFHEYYTGVREAPVLTLVVGGNHESSSYMQELRYGGWLAPNIYYLGDVGAVWYRGALIGGLSGIFNYHSFMEGAQERLPYSPSELRSVYHTKPHHLLRALLLPSDGIDVFMSHDWPNCIEHDGNVASLIKRKRFFAADISRRCLGSPVSRILLDQLRPRRWFSGHLHVQFAATVKHGAPVAPLNANEIAIDDMDNDMDDLAGEETGEERSEESASTSSYAHPSARTTEFLALDKPGRKRKFLSVVEVEPSNPSHPSANSDDLWYYEEMPRINQVVDAFEPIRGSRSLLDSPLSWPLLQQAAAKVAQLPVLEPTRVPANFEAVAPATATKLQSWPNNQTSAYVQMRG
ncbi:lariat debranching enzyme [Diutina catenulata]